MWFFPRLTETTFCAIFYVEQVEIEEGGGWLGDYWNPMKQGEAPRVDRVGAITQGNAIEQPGVEGQPVLPFR